MSESDISSVGPINAATSTVCAANDGATTGFPSDLKTVVRNPISVRVSAGATNNASDDHLSNAADPLDLSSKRGHPIRLSDCATRSRKTINSETAANTIADDQL